VFCLPHRNFTTFALAGVGALVFDPKDFAGAARRENLNGTADVTCRRFHRQSDIPSRKARGRLTLIL
jgi:hypothetical protein